MSVTVGLFTTVAEADSAVIGLYNLGFTKDEISIIARDRALRERWVEPGQAQATAVGASTGAAVGGIAGLLVGLGALMIPGIGPVITAGVWGSALASTAVGAGLGAIGGGLLGALTDMGIPDDEAGYYAEGVKRGGILVSVAAPENQVETVKELMVRSGAVDLRSHIESWRAEGWTGFDSTLEPMDDYPTLRKVS